MTPSEQSNGLPLCGQLCPNMVPAASCVKPEGHGGAHVGFGGRPQWLRSVEQIVRDAGRSL